MMNQVGLITNIRNFLISNIFKYPRYPNAPPRPLVRMPSQSDYPVRGKKQAKTNIKFQFLCRVGQ